MCVCVGAHVCCHADASVCVHYQALCVFAVLRFSRVCAGV